MKPTTLLGTLILLSTWSSVGATEPAPIPFRKPTTELSNALPLHAATTVGLPFSTKRPINRWISLHGGTAADVAGPTAVAVVVASVTPVVVAGAMVAVDLPMPAIEVASRTGETESKLYSLPSNAQDITPSAMAGFFMPDQPLAGLVSL